MRIESVDSAVTSRLGTRDAAVIRRRFGARSFASLRSRIRRTYHGRIRRRDDPATRTTDRQHFQAQITNIPLVVPHLILFLHVLGRLDIEQSPQNELILFLDALLLALSIQRRGREPHRWFIGHVFLAPTAASLHPLGLLAQQLLVQFLILGLETQQLRSVARRGQIERLIEAMQTTTAGGFRRERSTAAVVAARHAEFLGKLRVERVVEDRRVDSVCIVVVLELLLLLLAPVVFESWLWHLKMMMRF